MAARSADGGGPPRRDAPASGLLHHRLRRRSPSPFRGGFDPHRQPGLEPGQGFFFNAARKAQPRVKPGATRRFQSAPQLPRHAELVSASTAPQAASSRLVFFGGLALVLILETCANLPPHTQHPRFQTSLDHRAERLISTFFPAANPMHPASHGAFSQIERCAVFAEATDQRPIVLPSNASVLERLPQRDSFARCLPVLAERVTTIARDT